MQATLNPFVGSDRTFCTSAGDYCERIDIEQADAGLTITFGDHDNHRVELKAGEISVPSPFIGTHLHDAYVGELPLDDGRIMRVQMYQIGDDIVVVRDEGARLNLGGTNEMWVTFSAVGLVHKGE